MKIVFRADASLLMGSGHVMRCLTLADALRSRGAYCHFLTRVQPGNLIDVISQRGYKVSGLIAQDREPKKANKIKNAAVLELKSNLEYKPDDLAWFDDSWQNDAQETASLLARVQPDWLVVDHYGLDQLWEKSLAAHYRYLLVIDDLADRHHSCDLLLDQNLGRQSKDYASLVPNNCQVISGPEYALLRPEFAEARLYSLKRRKDQNVLRQLLISMGGVDLLNVTGLILQALKTCALPRECHITVVLGLTAPWLEEVKQLAEQMPWPTKVLVNVNDMAYHMAISDLAIGAAGSTSWERCCLGLPTLIIVLADNQQSIAASLERNGISITLCSYKDEHFTLNLKNTVEDLANNNVALMSLSQAAASVTNGCGANMLAEIMLGNKFH
jgi:UDP-2,4-diacetamido-2,4,6-trideoxy-beta-L-altropyranose hydrolase